MTQTEFELSTRITQLEFSCAAIARAILLHNAAKDIERFYTKDILEKVSDGDFVGAYVLENMNRVSE